METVIITGGTGMIGTAITKLLESKGYRVIIFSRRPHPPRGNIIYSLWNINKSIIDRTAIAEADHIIHLAGEGIADKRWTKKRKKAIADSRVNSSSLIVKALNETENRVRTVVCASAIGWYGADSVGSRAFVETDPPSNDFLGNTCRIWQESISPVEEMGKRLVLLRTGIVLANEGGAFKEFIKPMKAGIAAILSNGKQVISWIHINDIARLYMAAIEMQHFRGVYNATAPETISNRELMLKIARARKRPFIPVHVPQFALKLILGEMSMEVLKSTTVDGSKVKNAGFNFIFPTVDSAINDLIRAR